MRSRTSGNEVALVVADVEDFSKIMAERGWAAGDQVLAQVAGPFSGCLRDDDVVARMFGDVFAGACEDIEDSSTIALIVRRLAKAMSRPFDVDGERLDVTMNIGTAMAERDDWLEQAIRRAENAIDRSPTSSRRTP